MARVIAICEGGPLDRMTVSVELDADGLPGPLTSREEVVGCLYVPAGATDIPAAGTSEAGTELPHPFGWTTHERAFRYVPEEGGDG